MKFVIFLLTCILSFPVLAQQHGDGMGRWVQPGQTIRVLDNKVSVFVKRITRGGRSDYAEIHLNVPRRKTHQRGMKQGDYMKFDYYEKNYILNVLDVKLDDQKVLIQITEQ